MLPEILFDERTSIFHTSDQPSGVWTGTIQMLIYFALKQFESIKPSFKVYSILVRLVTTGFSYDFDTKEIFEVFEVDSV